MVLLFYFVSRSYLEFIKTYASGALDIFMKKH